VLAQYLDRLVADNYDVDANLEAVTCEWLSVHQAERRFDWRYYLIDYPSMREGVTGIYHGIDGKLGYSMAMLRTQELRGFYRDAVLLEIWRASGVGDQVEDPWFTGYDMHVRWLRLVRSGVGMQSIPEGLALQPPTGDALGSTFGEICAQHPHIVAGVDGLCLQVPQEEYEGELVDTIDRVVAGAALLRRFADAGL
jgi:hypothetical protein